MGLQGATSELTDSADRAAEQLNRILASKAFRQAGRLQSFLRFVVKETLAGRAEGLKEFAIGLEVFGKDPAFNPQSDPIVRVQARRLRAQLNRYYAEEGDHDEIVIEVPKGGYAAVFKPSRQITAAGPKRPGPSALVSRNTVLVLPFSDYSPASDQKHFCAGLSEEIIYALTKMEAVRLLVWSGGSEIDPGLDPREVAGGLNAGIVICGSVRKSNSEVRITTNLIDTATGSYVWSTSIDRKMENTFAVQEEVARAVAEKLGTELAGRMHPKGIISPTQNLAAYNFCVQGRYHLNQRTEEGLRKAVELFERAIVEDAEYAQAYSGLSDAYGLLGHYGGLSPADVWTKVASNAAWAVLKDEYSVEAHTSLAHVKSTQDWDWAGAEREFQRAINLDPRYPTAHHWYASSLLIPLAKLDGARDEMLLAQALDPISSIIARDIARVYYYMGDLEAALEQCDHTIELNPHFSPAYWMLGFVQARRGEFDESIAALQRAIQLSPRSPSMQAALGHTLAVSGKKSEALRILRELLDLAAKRYVSPFELALLHFAVGQSDEGFQFLGKAFQDRCFELISLKVDPRLDSVKSDPRFTALFDQLGLP